MSPDEQTQVALSLIAAGVGLGLMSCAVLLVFISTVLT